MERRNDNESGQSMVLIALFLVGLIAVLGLIVDVGNVYSQRRFMQNAADAGSVAGARALANCTYPNYQCELAVQSALGNFANSNGSPTDVAGFFIDASGNQVGGQLPSNNGVPPGAAGVKVVATKTFSTMFLGVIGTQGTSVNASAAAAFGPVASGGPSVMPLARKCGASLGPQDQCGLKIGTTYDIWQGDTSGNFGWLAWNAGLQNGTDTARMLVPGSTLSSTAYVEPVLPPNVDPGHPTCSALMIGCYVSGNTGVSNANNITTQLDVWKDNATHGIPMIIPVFDNTGTSGSNAWYHIVGFAAFLFKDYSLSGHGFVKGEFVEWYTSAPICASCKVTGLTGVQLIH